MSARRVALTPAAAEAGAGFAVELPAHSQRTALRQEGADGFRLIRIDKKKAARVPAFFVKVSSPFEQARGFRWAENVSLFLALCLQRAGGAFVRAHACLHRKGLPSSRATSRASPRWPRTVLPASRSPRMRLSLPPSLWHEFIVSRVACEPPGEKRAPPLFPVVPQLCRRICGRALTMPADGTRSVRPLLPGSCCSVHSTALLIFAGAGWCRANSM